MEQIAEPEETERKFLVKQTPTQDWLGRFKMVSIEQGYVYIGEEGDEVRVRSLRSQLGKMQYKLTMKSDGNLTRKEVEGDITHRQFHDIWSQTQDMRISKDRYYIPQDNLVYELDIYKGHLQGLIVVEVEFPDELSANLLSPPYWLGREVTHDKLYKNKYLSIIKR